MCTSDFLRKFNGYVWSNFKDDAEFAKTLHISPKLLRKYKKGEKEPEFDTVKLLANSGCDMIWLMKKLLG